MSKVQIATECHGFRLGQVLRDEVTGFEGTVTQIVTEINGNVRASLQPRSEDKTKAAEPLMFDHHGLVLVGEGIADKVGEITISDRIGLADEVEHNLSGFRGHTLFAAVFLNGCLYFNVVGKSKDNAKPASIFCPDSELKLVKAAKPPAAEAKKTGGPIMPAFRRD